MHTCTLFAPFQSIMKVTQTLAVFAMLMAVACAFYFKEDQVASHSQALKNNLARNAELFKSMGDYFHRMHLSNAKRCANLFDEGCSNGGIPGTGSDSDWINGGSSPGKRCTNLYDEGCSNGGIPGSGSDNDWINGGNSPGRR